MSPYTIVDHTADTGIEASAETLPELLEALATGMFLLMAAVDPCRPMEEISMKVPSGSAEDLVFDMLSELLYRSETEDLLFCDIHVEQPDQGDLTITAQGVSWEGVELEGPPIKAVTYHGLVVDEGEQGWFARVYFDV